MGWRKDGTDGNRWVVKTGVNIKEIAKVPESHRNKKFKKKCIIILQHSILQSDNFNLILNFIFYILIFDA